MRSHKSVACAASLGLAAALAAAGGAAYAQQAWKPTKPIEIVVTCQPGCGPDITARIMQKAWQDHGIVDVPVTVLNRPGGGGAVALNYLKQRSGDAHAIVFSGAGSVVATIMGRGVSHREVTSVAMMSAEYVGTAVQAGAPIRSGAELMALVRKDPEAVSFGVANALGNANHQSIALALRVSGIHPAKVKTVVFQSGGQAITALLGDHVQVVPASMGLWVTPRQSGQVRLIAVSSPRRLSGDFSDVPTWREQGVDAVVPVWRMVSAPPGLTAGQLAYWQGVLRRTTQTEEWKADLKLRHQSHEFIAGAELGPTIDELYGTLKALLTDIGLAKKRAGGGS